MRKAIGIKSLIKYLHSVSYPLTEEEILELILNKSIPHLRPLSDMIVFNLDHVDSWLSQQQQLKD
ncbi:hypothetical protein ACN6MY_19375 [Peribacillus sp. B-H-3]|uniref:hypothetical protein n=1 Tax=Peribacillus sp. B-H-3 TaxID=3400420 RepID=UPI003B02C644